jgi:hypothetical protein
VVDPGSEAVDSAVNDATNDATAPALETGNQAIAPVHDAVCPPAHDILDPVLGGDEPTEDAPSEEATEQGGTAAGRATEAAPAASSAAPTSTDLPDRAPTAT